jgi:hypothetical protein
MALDAPCHIPIVREASEAQQNGNRLGNFGFAERPAPRGLIIDLEKTAQLRPATARALGWHRDIASQSCEVSSLAQ